MPAKRHTKSRPALPPSKRPERRQHTPPRGRGKNNAALHAHIARENFPCENPAKPNCQGKMTIRQSQARREYIFAWLKCNACRWKRPNKIAVLLQSQ
jgi:hypothetical protein